MTTNLFFMVGLSGSGKSTVAKKIQKFQAQEGRECVILSDKDVFNELQATNRKKITNNKVFEVMRQKLKENIYIRDVVLDCTNLTYKERFTFFSALNQDKRKWIKIFAVVVATELDECYARYLGEDRDNYDILLEKQVRRFQLPYFYEGFDDVVLIGPETYNTFDIEAQKIIRNYKMDSNSCNDSIWGTSEDFLFMQMRDFDRWKGYQGKLESLCTHSKGVLNLVEYDKPKNRVLKRVAYLHDFGKIYTQADNPKYPGQKYYPDHANVGAYYLMTVPDKRRYVGLETEDEFLFFLFMVNYHMEPYFWKRDKTVRKFAHIFSPYEDTLIFFANCDKIAAGRKDYTF